MKERYRGYEIASNPSPLGWGHSPNRGGRQKVKHHSRQQEDQEIGGKDQGRPDPLERHRVRHVLWYEVIILYKV
jgi:hypothetical protein